MGVLGGGGVDHRENRGVTNVGYRVSDGLENRCRQEGGRLWQWSVLLESVYRLWVVLPSSYILIGSLYFNIFEPKTTFKNSIMHLLF